MKKTLTAIPALAVILLSSHVSFAEASPITKAEVLQAEKTWGEGIVSIGKAFTDHGDYKMLAKQHVDSLYAYGKTPVLFKPTKAANVQFRPTEPEAVSYFVGGVVPEDHGFAVQPWSKVRFENAGIITGDDYAEAMGNYYFTDAKTGKEVKAEFTFAYTRGESGELLINLHHSSFPYNPTH